MARSRRSSLGKPGRVVNQSGADPKARSTTITTGETVTIGGEDKASTKTSKSS
jgi:hypothetical protein